MVVVPNACVVTCRRATGAPSQLRYRAFPIEAPLGREALGPLEASGPRASHYRFLRLRSWPHVFSTIALSSAICAGAATVLLPP